MFKDYVFTTIMFLDYGKDNGNSPDGYVYAYGLDYNWRDSFSGRVTDPTNLYLARVPGNSVQDRSKWEFFSGTAGSRPGAGMWAPASPFFPIPAGCTSTLPKGEPACGT